MWGRGRQRFSTPPLRWALSAPQKKKKIVPLKRGVRCRRAPVSSPRLAESSPCRSSENGNRTIRPRRPCGTGNAHGAFSVPRSSDATLGLWIAGYCEQGRGANRCRALARPRNATTNFCVESCLPRSPGDINVRPVLSQLVGCGFFFFEIVRYGVAISKTYACWSGGVTGKKV